MPDIIFCLHLSGGQYNSSYMYIYYENNTDLVEILKQ